jgi:hypothetical protein
MATKHLRIHPEDDAGLTLIEVCLAMIVLTTAAVGAGSLFAVSLNAVAAARSQTVATMLAVQKVEQLRALLWRFADQGVLVAITDDTSDLSGEFPAGGGSGLRSSPAGALDTNTAGFVDFLDGRGQWVGTGATPPPAAVFVRRWSISQLPLNSDDAVVIRVLTTTVVRNARASAGPARRRMAGEALVTTVLARKAG